MEYPDFRLDDQVALVTGASKGIGWDLAKALAAAGAAVAVAARDLRSLERLASEIRADGGDAIAVQLDVRDVREIGPAFDPVHPPFGSLALLLTNSGLRAAHPAYDVTETFRD